MRPLREAQADVFSRLPLLPVVSVPIGEALGLVLAAPLIADAPVPPFANSAMDGYAVRAGDVISVPVELRVVEEVAAGMNPTTSVDPGTAIKVMTGAPLPEGADAVVRVEDTSQEGTRVTIRIGAPAGTAIRPAGGDVTAGSTVFSAGTRLTAAHLGVIANLGQPTVTVRARPRVALASTGDELVPVDGPPLGPGQIRDSNRPMLAASLAELGAIVVDLGPVPD
ncbi:MAG: molybdopterin molybdotransferase MoeA, partial [Actinomycetota bacterium]